MPPEVADYSKEERVKVLQAILLTGAIAISAPVAFAQTSTQQSGQSDKMQQKSGGQKQGGESVTSPGSAPAGQNKEGQVQSK